VEILNLHSRVFDITTNNFFFLFVLLQTLISHLLDKLLILPWELFYGITLIDFHNANEFSITFNLFLIDHFLLTIDLFHFSKNRVICHTFLFYLILKHRVKINEIPSKFQVIDSSSYWAQEWQSRKLFQFIECSHFLAYSFLIVSL